MRRERWAGDNSVRPVKVHVTNEILSDETLKRDGRSSGSPSHSIFFSFFAVETRISCSYSRTREPFIWFAIYIYIYIYISYNKSMIYIYTTPVRVRGYDDTFIQRRNWISGRYLREAFRLARYFFIIIVHSSASVASLGSNLILRWILACSSRSILFAGSLVPQHRIYQWPPSELSQLER